MGESLFCYELLDLIGEGGGGRVFKARHKYTGQIVALKVITLQKGKLWEQKYRFFLREAKVLAKLSHPAIPRVLEVGDEGKEKGIVFLAMELVEGEKLSDILKRKKVQISRALDWIRQIAEVLDYLHTNCVIHRDLKPAHLFILPKGQVKITDFGFSTVFDEDWSSVRDARQIIGSLRYIAPEGLAHDILGPFTASSDVYALGLILYELLTGVPAFSGTPADIVIQKLKGAPPLKVANLPKEVELLYYQMTCLEPEKRPSARFVADKLRELTP